VASSGLTNPTDKFPKRRIDNMKIARLAGLMFVVVTALSLAVASAAFGEAEFKQTGLTFTGKSDATNELASGNNKVACTGNTTKGTISSAFLAGGVTVSFTGCTSAGKTKSGCVASSVGAPAGDINTETLHGVLGLILPKGTGTGVALVLLPAVSKGDFVELAENECTVGTAVEGNVGGEVVPVGKKQNTGLLNFQPNGAVESIKVVDLASNGALITTGLKAFGGAATQKTDELLSFSGELEVS
jgi:hypothetical protein